MRGDFVLGRMFRKQQVVIVCGLILGVQSPSSWAFFANGQWTVTATDQAASPLGNPVTLTWSIVPDGTLIRNVVNGQDRTSDLISDFDALLGGGTGPLEERPWFTFFEQSFGRWSELSGVNVVYEPNDDGQTLGEFPGELGTRGDIRIGGATIDGNGGAYGQAGFVPFADITIDTSDTLRFGNPSGNYFELRQTLMHEFGHSLGLGHNQALGAFVLMHPFAQTLFDGPQFDDIRGAHHLYGDVYEKGSPNGNNSPANATPLGPIPSGTTREVGADVPFQTSALSPALKDFVSISNDDDIDFWKFSILDPSIVDLQLTPGGFLYQEKRGNELQFTAIDTRQQSNLSLELWSLGGEAELLMSASDTGFGIAESLIGVALDPGEYAARVSGNTANVQLYALSIGVEADPIVTTIAGDFNADSVVNLADYARWRDLLGSSAALQNAPASPGFVDIADYQTWKSNFGTTTTVAAVANVPEPGSQVVLGLGIALAYGAWRRCPRVHSSGASGFQDLPSAANQRALIAATKTGSYTGPIEMLMQQQAAAEWYRFDEHSPTRKIHPL